MHYSTELSINLIGVGSVTTSFLLDRKANPPDLEMIKTLKREDVWKFDRSATYRWSRGSAKASDAFMYTSYALPALLLINDNVRNEYYTGVIYLETLLFTAGVTNLTKVLTKRKRPYMYNPDVPDSYKMEKDGIRSFFSGHTSMTAASSFFMAKAFADLNPGSKYKPYVWTTGAVIPAITGILRYTAGKHYPTDIIVGYLIGTAAGILVPHLHKLNHSAP